MPACFLNFGIDPALPIFASILAFICCNPVAQLSRARITHLLFQGACRGSSIPQSQASLKGGIGTELSFSTVTMHDAPCLGLNSVPELFLLKCRTSPSLNPSKCVLQAPAWCIALQHLLSCGIWCRLLLPTRTCVCVCLCVRAPACLCVRVCMCICVCCEMPLSSCTFLFSQGGAHKAFDGPLLHPGQCLFINIIHW